ncbi:hypothetical protein, partial [Bacillus sp. (in: firmicutes)]|uniref:hypothetical protein n=1 Tax=Bacillus sp. TaxID=1409 RepID=UPI0023F0F078
NGYLELGGPSLSKYSFLLPSSVFADARGENCQPYSSRIPESGTRVCQNLKTKSKKKTSIRKNFFTSITILSCSNKVQVQA